MVAAWNQHSQAAQFEGLQEPPESLGRSFMAYCVLILQVSVAFLPLYTVPPPHTIIRDRNAHPTPTFECARIKGDVTMPPGWLYHEL